LIYEVIFFAFVPHPEQLLITIMQGYLAVTGELHKSEYVGNWNLRIALVCSFANRYLGYVSDVDAFG